MLGTLTIIDDATARAGWADATGATLAKEFPTEREAVLHIARSCAGGLRFHGLRHSYATWLEMSRIASDATFNKIGERLLPATLPFVVDHVWLVEASSHAS
jgi:integrase